MLEILKFVNLNPNKKKFDNPTIKKEFIDF